MAFFKFNNIRVAGVACAVPRNEVKTESYKSLFGDEEVEKFIQMTGVRSSHRTLEHQTCSDLGFRAAQELLAHKGVDPSEIGACIFSSHSPDYRRPATAFVLQYRLGIPKEAVCYDISLGCSSLVVGMQTVASIMNTGDIRKALLFVGDTAGKSVYPEDRSSAMLFGEAGAVMLLEKTDDPKDEINALVRSDGSGYRYMIVPGGARQRGSGHVRRWQPPNADEQLHSGNFGVHVYHLRCASIDQGLLCQGRNYTRRLRLFRFPSG